MNLQTQLLEEDEEDLQARRDLDLFYHRSKEIVQLDMTKRQSYLEGILKSRKAFSLINALDLLTNSFQLSYKECQQNTQVKNN